MSLVLEQQRLSHGEAQNVDRKPASDTPHLFATDETAVDYGLQQYFGKPQATLIGPNFYTYISFKGDSFRDC